MDGTDVGGQQFGALPVKDYLPLHPMEHQYVVNDDLTVENDVWI